MAYMTKLLLLSGVLWLSAILFIVYAWIIQSRQQMILRYIAKKLQFIEKNIKENNKGIKTVGVENLKASETPTTKLPPETTIAIDKNEPLSKYETVTLPDAIDINFVDR